MRGLVRTRGCQGSRTETGGERREGGQSLLETAIVLPILFLLLAAVVDFGRAFDAYIVLTNAAREGARFASLAFPLTEDEIKTLVYQDVVGSGTNISAMGNFSTTGIVLEQGSGRVTVTVSYDFDLYFGGLVGVDTFPLAKSAVMARK